MEGRRIGERGNYKGTAYLAAEFARLGLKPAGDSGTYFQDLPYGPLSYDAGATRLAVAGASLAAKKDWFPLSPMAGGGFSPNGSLDKVTSVFAGRWGDSTALDPAVFRGKLAVFLAAPNAPGTEAAARPAVVLARCDSLPDMFGAAAAAHVEAERAAGRLPTPPRPNFGGTQTRDIRAQNAGAVGVLIVSAGELSPSGVALAYGSRMVMQPTAFDQFIVAEKAKAEQIVRAAGIKID